jgi:hypothetical protein
VKYFGNEIPFSISVIISEMKNFCNARLKKPLRAQKEAKNLSPVLQLSDLEFLLSITVHACDY